MAATMRDIRLPGPEGRVVVFGGNVFKLKYKLSQINIKEVKHNFDGRIRQIQDDIRELTAAILDQICAESALVPLRTDCVVIFSEFLPWDKVNRLEFGYSNCMLTPYPKMVFMLVRILPPPETCPDAPKGSVMLGKHKLGALTQAEAREEGLLSVCVDKSSKKKLKICSHSPEKGQESVVEAALPLEPATFLPAPSLPARFLSPSFLPAPVLSSGMPSGTKGTRAEEAESVEYMDASDQLQAGPVGWSVSLYQRTKRDTLPSDKSGWLS